MTHPLQSISPARRGRVFLVLFICTLVVMYLMNVIGAPLNTPAAPSGIISFELAGTLDNSQKMLDSWDVSARLHAALSLGFDYLFMLVYSTTLALACVWAGEVLKAKGLPLATLGVPLGWGSWLAAVFDAVENLALIMLLFGSLADPWPRLAQICAIFKFSLILLGILYPLYAGSAHLLWRMTSRKSATL